MHYTLKVAKCSNDNAKELVTEKVLNLYEKYRTQLKDKQLKNK